VTEPKFHYRVVDSAFSRATRLAMERIYVMGGSRHMIKSFPDNGNQYIHKLRQKKVNTVLSVHRCP
jgi:hypothetical protein